MSKIQIVSGRHFDFLDPDSTPLFIDEIAWALSHNCRFTGHIKVKHGIYSVAQHLTLASMYAPPAFAYEALMHDAPEAVLGDVASPLKRLLPDYKKIEKSVTASIAKHFCFSAEMSPEVHEVDLRMLATERRDLMAEAVDPSIWFDMPPAYDPPIVCWSPERAYELFMGQFNKLAPFRKIVESRLTTSDINSNH